MRKIIRSIVSITILANMAMADDEKNLFEFVDRDKTDLSKEQSDALAYFSTKKWNVRTSVVRIDGGLLSEPGVSLNVERDLAPVATLGEAMFTQDRVEWRAQPSSDVSDATLIRRDGNITGSIWTRNRLFSLRPIGGGLHALIERNQSEFPPDHPPEFEEAQLQEAMDEAELDLDAIDDSVNYRIDVMVLYTPAVSRVVNDVRSLIDLAMAETNASYSFSRVNATLKLVHHAEVNYRESGSFKTDVDRLAGTSDGHIDGIHALRNSHDADVVVLLINDDQACGRAKAIYANAATAFAVCHYDCATGYYSFGHEIGHLQGARHNPEADPSSSPFPYGHGYYKNSWRTIMSYNCPGGCTRQKFWSNPDTTHGGIPTGTSALHDNARVLNATARRLSRFR